MDQTPPNPEVAAQSRRRVLQSAVVMALGAATANFQTSLAGRGWCRSDPLITIEGVPADIFCTARLTALLSVNGPTEIVVSVPVGVSTALVLAGPGFGWGEEVRFEETDRLQRSESSVDLEVAVYVPAKEDLAIGVEFAPRVVGILSPARADGFANQWITLATQLSTDGLLGLLPSDANNKGGHKGHSRSKRKGKSKRH
jgi:hypothetical protein